MSVYLVILPKKDSEELNHKNLLKRTAFEYSELFREIGYKPYTFISDNLYNSGSVIIWDRIDPNSFFYKSSNGVWTVSSSTNVSQNIAENTCRRGGELNYLQPVWGHYTVVRAEMYLSQFQAWNTIPAIEAIHYAEDDNYIYISNRPLPIALAMSQGVVEEINMNKDFLAEYLAFGYSISGDTTYENVKILSPNKMLNVKNGSLSFKNSPCGMASKLSVDHSQEEAKDYLKTALENSMNRSIKNMRGRKIQLRMSGGKDSRLCALLARPYSDKFFSVNFGDLAEMETKLSAVICDYVDIPLEITSPKLMPGDSIREKVEKQLLYSDGILPSEPHTSIYLGSDPRTDNESIMMGQWPLFKGGYANTMQNNEKVLKDKLVSIIFPILKEDEHDKFKNQLINWFNKQESSSNLEKLYLFSRTFRSGRWMQSSVALCSRSADVLFPISDSEVTVVSDALTMFEKVSQVTLYSVMNIFDNYVTHLPLANSGWPAGTRSLIEKSPNHGLVTDIQDKLKELEGRTKYVEEDYISTMSNEVIFEITGEIVKSPRYGNYKKILNSYFIDAIESCSETEMLVPANMHKRIFKSALWRLYVADVWLSEIWLK